MKRYKDIQPAKGLSHINLACCDCGLVHQVGWTISDDGKIELTFLRDARKTAANRRHKSGYLFTGTNGYKIVRRKSRPK